MLNDTDILKEDCLKDILGDYPESFVASVLNEMPAVEFYQVIDTPFLFLQRHWRKNDFAETFVEFFDERKKHGSGLVHVFFYRLADKKFLQLLRNKEKVLEMIPAQHRQCFNRKSFSWSSWQPELVEIRHDYDGNKGEGTLLFKWVEERAWAKRTEGTTASSPPAYEQRRERAVQFFIVDLKSGEAQLRIQIIKPNSLKSKILREQYAFYWGEVEKLLRPGEFRRLALESVVKKFLTKKDIEPKSWEIQLPSGGNFTAKGKPALYVTIGKGIKVFGFIFKAIRFNVLRLLDFFGRKLNCECLIDSVEWGVPEVRIDVDGEKDILTIKSPADPFQFAAIIDKAMSVKENKVIDKVLNRFFKSSAVLARVVLSFDYHFSRFKNNQVTVKEILKNEWLPKDEVVDAINRLCLAFPKQFGSRGLGESLTLYKI
jgi:hypothetical protein